MIFPLSFLPKDKAYQLSSCASRTYVQVGVYVHTQEDCETQNGGAFWFAVCNHLVVPLINYYPKNCLLRVSKYIYSFLGASFLFFESTKSRKAGAKLFTQKTTKTASCWKKH